MQTRQERKGVIFALASAALWGIFPVMVNRGSHNIAPLTFAAISTLLAAAVSFIYAALKGKLGELKKKEAYGSLLMITLCIVIVPYTLLFIGSSKTSGVNTSMLLLSEIIFTLMFTHFIGEKTTVEKLIGASAVLIGALLISYNGKFQLNIGDIMIIFSTVTYPIGNFYAKKALNQVSPSTILFVRFLLGGLFILPFAMLAGTGSGMANIISTYWPMLVFTGVILLGAGKIAWYEGLDRLDISKAVSLGMTFPLFSLLILIAIFKEPISRYQWFGIAIMAAGIFFSIRRSSVDPTLTGYAAK
jgi:drug/metabolite transporter (DMT)-like permease